MYDEQFFGTLRMNLNDLLDRERGKLVEGNSWEGEK